MLLSSAKFQDKAEEIVKDGTENKPLVMVEKIKDGNQSAEKVELQDVAMTNGGLMLYTSGTTSRPVSFFAYGSCRLLRSLERCFATAFCINSAV
jgi:acyl-coenzyme A synthetase/AMP-(fatty) acid ligase